LTFKVIFSKGEDRVEREVSGAIEVGEILAGELQGYVWKFKDEEMEKAFQSLTNEF